LKLNESKKEEKGLFKQPLFTPDQSSISGTLFTPETTISSIKTTTPHSNFFTPDLNSNFLSGPSSINSILNTPISSQPKESVKNLFSTPEITSKQKEFTSKISEGAPPVVKRKQKIHTKDSKIQKLTPLKDLEDAFFNPLKDEEEEEEDIPMMTLLTILGEGFKLFSEFS
jgi:hypothetical protein